MSDTRGILDQRLAKGEITEDEYDRLIAKLGAAQTVTPQAPSSGGGKDLLAKILGWGGGTLICVSLLRFLMSGAEGLEISNIRGTERYSGTDIEFTLVNTSKKATDAVAWVEVDDRKICPKLIAMTAKSRWDIKFRCDHMPKQAKFFVRVGWASDNGRMARAADRLKIKDN